MSSTVTDYAEFIEWKKQRDAEAAAEKEKREKLEDFVRQQRIDNALMDGVRRGQTWEQFLRSTQAPGSLRERYLELQQQSGVEPGSVMDDRDLFIMGFTSNQ